MKCPRCGTENASDAGYCEACGASFGAAPAPVAATDSLSTRQLQAGPATPKSAVSSLKDTTPLGEFTNRFAALPEGAILGRRYIVREVRVEGETHNVYLAEGLVPARECPNCHAVSETEVERYCSDCGAELQGTEPAVRRYLVQERVNGNAFAMERQLLGMQLAHPGLLLPLEVFQEAPYGDARTYRVVPEFAPPLAQTLVLPQPWGKVVSWGAALAQAMAHLHQHQIAIGAVDVAHIAVDGDQALWTGLSDVKILPPEQRSDAGQVFAVDVQRLAAALIHLGTGKEQPATGLELPVGLKQLLGQALDGISAAQLAAQLRALLGGNGRSSYVSLVVGARSDVGPVRELNEDKALTRNLSAGNGPGPAVGLVLVADGMGGYDAGEVASDLACRAVAALAETEPPRVTPWGDVVPEPGEWLTRAVQAANRSVFDQRRAASSDMGTTMVTALVIGAGIDGETDSAPAATATIANVGDSRCYHLGDGSIRRVTVDHSLVERLVAAGQITAEEALNHPQRNVIYRAIGDQPEVEVDLYAQLLRPGEALLLCSDGLSGKVRDERLLQIWQASMSPQEACDRMVEAAVQAGGEDNITAVIIRAVS